MMNNGNLLSTSQFAELCDVEKSTLRFYRDRGVLLPGLIQNNGYGKYEPIQGLDVAHIKLLENCGFSLREIGDSDGHLFLNFPYDEVLSLLEREERSLAAKKAMITVAQAISKEIEQSECKIEIRNTGKQYFLFQEYSKPSDDIRYNFIHSIKLITRLSIEYLGISPFVLGRVVGREHLLSRSFHKVSGLVIPIPENVALSGDIKEEFLLCVEESVMLRLCYNGKPYSFQAPYERVINHIMENGIDISGDSLEFWTMGNRFAGENTYATLIDIPVNLP